MQQIIPLEENIVKVKKDKPIIIKSIPLNKQRNNNIERLSMNINLDKNMRKNDDGDKPDSTILNYSISSLASQKPLQMPHKQQCECQVISSDNANSKGLNIERQYELAIGAHNKATRHEQSYQQHNSDKDDRSVKSLLQRNYELAYRLKSLESTLHSDPQSIQLQRKANQIYTEFYHSLSRTVSQFLKLNPSSSINLSESQKSITTNSQLNETLNMDKIIHTVGKLIESYYEKNLQHHYNYQLNVQQHSHQRFEEKSMQTQGLDEQHVYYQNNQNNEAIETYYIEKIKQLQNIIQEGDQQIIRLKSQLLQSTQNNINAIFNTQLSSASCLENQVKKINTEMTNLKEKINLILINNNQHQLKYLQHQQQPQIIYLPQPNIHHHSMNEKKQKSASKIIKIYTTKDTVHESSDQQENHNDNEQSPSRSKKLQHSLSRKHKGKSSSRSEKSISSSSSISSRSKSTKKREQMSRKQIEHLKQAYSQTKNELNVLINTFSMISSAQLQMRTYFNQIKEGFLREVNEKLVKVKEEEEERRWQIQKKREQQKLRYKAIIESEKQMQLRYQELMKQRQCFYEKELSSIQKQQSQDKQTISQLSNRLIQLTNKQAVPERVTQELLSKTINLSDIEQELPTSDISISVDCLRLIQQLKKQNHKLKQEIASLLKSNNFLSQEIQHNMPHRSQSTKGKNIYYSDSIKRKVSIINQLNDFSKERKYPIEEGFDLSKKEFYGKVREGLQSTEYIVDPSNMIKQSSQINQHQQSANIYKLSPPQNNITQFESQRNRDFNIKTILHSKQAQIKNLQKQIINLQQAIEYLKQQLSTKQQIISDLETYIGKFNLQNRPQNSSPMSKKQINQEPEINVYNMGQQNKADSMTIKYQNYVKNLKILLKETQNQNHLLKQQLQNIQKQSDSFTQSNIGLKNSAAHSQRTTKNSPSSTLPANSKFQIQIMMRKEQQKINQPLQNQKITFFSQ